MHHYFPISVWRKRKPPLKKGNKNSHILSESQPAQVDISAHGACMHAFERYSLEVVSLTCK